ncbi:MAG: GIY-YIG nuclease family protein [Enhydrobacter sp.]|nr:MAG: GIY-YIG nuclease family protein [Enhydrobacter sp.]
MNNRQFWVYILTSSSGNAMYIGVTNNLENRIWEHRSGTGSEFAKKYRVTRLVYAEEYDNPTDAIAREKQLKGWRRERKNGLVRTINPMFRDLMPDTRVVLSGAKDLVERAAILLPARDPSLRSG